MVIDIGNYEDEQEKDSGGGGSNDPEPDKQPKKDKEKDNKTPVRDEDGDFIRTVDEIGEEKGTDGKGSSNVVVPEDPAERQKLQDQDKTTAVGSGDTKEEARKDAAKNPEFDADTGDPVNKQEKRLGTNQPLQNIEGSSTKEIQNRLQEVAKNQRGDRTGRKAGELAQQLEQRQKEKEKQQQRERQFAKNDILQRNTNFDVFTRENASRTQPSNNEEDPIERGVRRLQGIQENLQESKAAELVDPTQSVDGQRSFGKEVSDVGQEIITGSSQGAERATERVPQLDILGSGLGGNIAAIEQFSRGEDDKAAKELLLPGSQTQQGDKRAEQATEGIIAGPANLAGFTVGTTGATMETTSNEIEKALGREPTGPTTGEAISTGLGIQKEVISQNPGRFAAEEIGEEAGEFVGTAGLGLFAPTVTVDPSVDISPDSRTGRTIRKARDAKNTATGIFSGNLGSTVESEVIDVRSPETVEQNVFEQRLRNLGPTVTQERAAQIQKAVENFRGDTEGDLLITRTRQEDGETVRGVVGTKNGQVVQGVRRERPVTRTEFLKDAISRENLAQAAAVGLQGAAAASGAPTSTASVSITPDSTTPSTSTPSNTPDTNTVDPDNIFPETRSPADKSTDITPDIENTLTIDQDLNQEPSEELIPETQQIDIPGQEQDPFQIQDPEQTPRQQQDPLVTPGQQQKPLIPEEQLTLDPTPEQTPSNTNTPTVRGQGQNSLDDLFSTGLEPEDNPKAAPSVDAILFGDTTDQEVEDDTVFTGFEQRKVEDDDIFNLF